MTQGTEKRQDGKLDVMISQTLSSTFDLGIWSLISSKTAEEFIKGQGYIFSVLLSDSKLFQSFFHKFYTNHQHLNDWFMLANYNQVDIKRYVFSHLLSKTFKEYQQIFKNQSTSTHHNRINEAFGQEEKVKKEKKKLSFQKKCLSSAKSSLTLNIYQKQPQKIQQLSQRCKIMDKQVEKQDYHELFLRTFNACDGSKYIYYDFHRHMRGIEDKKRYNQFIRIRGHKKHHSNNIEANLSTSLLHQNIKKRRENLKKANEGVKSSHNSICIDQIDQNIAYGGKKQDQFFHVNYCNFRMDAIGQIKQTKYPREVLLLKQTTGGLKKVRAKFGYGQLQLRNIKVQ